MTVLPVYNPVTGIDFDFDGKINYCVQTRFVIFKFFYVQLLLIVYSEEACFYKIEFSGK